MLKFHALEQDGSLADGAPSKFCSFGITEALVPLVVGGLTSLGVGGTTAGILGSGLVDAGLGAGMSALTGSNIGTGALIGGIGGLASGAMGGMGGGASGIAPQALPGSSAAAGAAPAPGATGAGQAGFGMPGTQNAAGAIGAPGGALTANAAQAARALGTSSPLGGLNGLAGLMQFLGRAKPLNTTPGVAQTGPYWNKPLQSSGAINQTINPNFAPATGNWQTYGQAPEQPFYSSNQVHFAHGGGVLNRMAKGGGRKAQFDSTRGDSYVQGDGDGMSDDVNAKLSDGEFVFNADAVSALGNGSNRKGAAVLNEVRKRVMHDRGIPRTVPKKLKKSPLEYFKEAAS